MALGMKLNNPGNIRKSGTTYNGEVASNNGGFKQFSDMKYGVRAMASLLWHYIHSSGYDTINKIIHVYAPSSDGNNPDSYANLVANQSGITADQQLSTVDFEAGITGESNIVKIMREMIRVEQGQYINESDLSDGYSLFLQSVGL